MYRYLMFDLDGTLVASEDGIIESVRYSLKCLNMEAVEREILKKFIGPPLMHSYMEFLGLDEETANRAVDFYRVHYEKEGHLLSPLYEGIEETLTKLKEQGKTLLVVTSKPINMARRIIHNTGIEHYFTDIIGPLPEEKTLEKEEMIRRAFKRNRITSGKDAVMIGDRQFDIWAAKKNKVDCIAVLYGYGSLDEFEREGADIIIRKPEELLTLV